MKKYFEIIVILSVALILGLFLNLLFSKGFHNEESLPSFKKEELEQFFFREKVSREELNFKFLNDQKIKILLVPGHTEEFVGAQFENIREVDLNVRLAQKIENIFKYDSRFEIYNFQREVGIFDNDMEKIISDKEEVAKFKDGYRGIHDWFMKKNLVNIEDDMSDTDTPEEIIDLLYGLNIWANKNDVDIVIHVHFNDYEGRGKNEVGIYKGFSIYVPDEKWSNSSASLVLAEALRDSLGKILNSSNNLDRDQNLVHDAELIGLGSFNTLEAASVLIEYGFIYEIDLFSDLEMKKMAEQTYFGIIQFLE